MRAVFGDERQRAQRELDQEHDGPPDRRRRRGRGRRLRARDRPRRDAGQRQLREPDPDCDLNLIVGAAAAPARAHGDVEFVRLRRLEQLRRAAPSRRSRRRRATEAHGETASPRHRHAAPSAPRACDPDAILDARARRAPRDRARSGSGTPPAGRRATPARSPISIARALVDDRKLHKLIRRTDLVRPLRRGPRDRRLGHRRASRRAGRGGRARLYSDRTGVYVGSGGGNYQNQYDYFPLMTEARRRPADVRPRARQHRQSDVAAAHAAEQRARPHRHPPRPEGPERLHHQPQRRRHAGGDRGDGGAAQRRGRSRGRGRPRRADRAADGALLPAAGPARDRRAAAVRRAPRRQPVRRRRRRADAGDRGVGARARRHGARRGAGRRLRVRSARACSRSATTATASRARSRAALDDARHRAGRRRHDRRARQRHAAIRCVGSRGDPRRVRRREPPPVTAFKWCVRAPDRRGGHRRHGARARGARARAACRASRRSRRSTPIARACAVSATAQAPRSDVALDPLPRLRRHQRRAASFAPPDAAARAWRTAAATAGRLRHRHRRDRAHRAPARAKRPPPTSRSSSPRRSSPTRRRPGTRREPRRALRRQGSLPQAVPARGRAGADRGRGFLGRARQLRRAAGRAVAPTRASCSTGTASRRSRCR